MRMRLRESGAIAPACRVVTTELSTRILLAAQLRAFSERFAWTVVAGDVAKPLGDGITHVCVPMRREPAMSDFRSLRELYRFFRRNRFAFVQTHTPKASMLALPAARLAGHRTIYTMHGALYYRDNSRLGNLAGWAFERWCCSWAHMVLMQSAEDVEVLCRDRVCPTRKARYLGNGIDIERYSTPTRQDRSRSRPVVLNTSRLVTEKGCLDFFTVAERLVGRADFVHVGPTEHDQSDAVEKDRIEDLRSRGIVRFAGEVDDVRPYLAEADIFVLPSYREGIPRAAMEAAVSGLPVVAYDVRGVREMVPSGHGLLARRGDVDGVVAAVLRLLDDDAARRSAADACRAHVTTLFDERLVYDRLRGVYAEP